MCKKFTYLLFFFFLPFSIPVQLFAYTNFTVSGHQTEFNTNKVNGRFAMPSLSLFKKTYTGFWFNSNSYNFGISATSSQPITICSGASIVIRGDVEVPVPDSYSWQVLQGSVWINAPGTNNGADYPPALLVNNTGTDILFNIRRQITVGGVVSYDSYYDVTVQPSSPISNNAISAPTVTVFCSSGSPATITGTIPTGGSGSNAYQWQSSVDNINFTNIPGANSSTYTPAQLTATTYFHRMVTSGSCVVPSLSNTVAIVIIPAVSNNVITAPAINTFCTPSDPAAISGNIPSGGDGTYTYQWQQSTDNVNFSDIAGATSVSYDPAVISTTTYFRRSAISNVCSVPVYSNVATIEILSPVANNSINAPAVTTFCTSGDAAVITGSSPTGGNGSYTYQWQQSTDNVNFSNIPGATAPSYDPPAVGVTTYFRRAAISGQCTTPVISNVITINIAPLPLLPVPVASSVAVCSGSSATLSVSSPQAGLVYNWYDSPTKTNLLFTGTNFTTPAITNNTTYYVESANGICSSSSLVSVQAVITLPVPITNDIVTAPGLNTFCAPGDPSVIIGNTPSGGSGVYTYQWQQSADNINFSDIPGATAINYDPPVTSSTTYFRRTAISGQCSAPVYSNAVSIVILPLVANNVISAPAVTTFCSSGDAAIVTGNIPAGGNGAYNYQWQQSTDNVSFTDIAGANTISYDPPVVTTTTYFRRNVTSGPCAVPLASNVITINIAPAPVLPVLSASSVTVCPGSAASLSVSSPQAGLVYNWYDSASKTNLLHTGTSFATQALLANTTYYVESSNGTCASSTLVAVQVNMAVQPTAPVLVNNAVSTCNGSAVTLSVANPQSGFTYNWYQSASGGNVLYSGVNFTSPAITANMVYYVEAANPFGCISARTPANANVTPLPQLSVQGSSVCPGSTAMLSATADVPNYTINWYSSASGGTPVYTGNAFTIPSLSSNLSYYAEAINNVTGCVSASRALVQATVLQPLPAPVVTVSNIARTSITFSWSAVADAIGYQVSTDNGASYSDPSTGSTGLSHTVSGLSENQTVNILVRAIGNSGCQLSGNSTAVSAVTENFSTDIYIANAFTPNGDGKNDVVYVHGGGIKTLNFCVYSQWGELLFNSHAITEGWDGTYKGAREPAGVYVYYLKAVLNSGEPVTRKGTITLLR